MLQSSLKLNYDVTKMKHKEGIGMDTHELVERYNQALKEGKSSDEFAESIGMHRKSMQQRLRRSGYVFDKTSNRYILKENGETNASDHKEGRKIIQKSIRQQDNNIEEDEILKMIKSLSDRVEKLEKIEKYRSVPDASTTEQSKELQLRVFDSPVKQISYRYHVEVLEALDKLCKRYPNYTKHVIINSLLLDALDGVNG